MIFIYIKATKEFLVSNEDWMKKTFLYVMMLQIQELKVVPKTHTT